MEPLTLLGVRIDPLTIDELNTLIAEAIATDKRWIIANHNLHSIYIYYHDSKMRAFFHKAHVIHIDGMPLLYWANILGHALGKDRRVTYVDWVHPLMIAAEANGWRVFYLGGRPGVAAQAAEKLRQIYPRLFLQTRHGYFAPEDNKDVLDALAAFKPHILMVGMGMPRQEHWILDNFEYLEANAILTAGACFDYVAGAIPTPPRWMGRYGLEWAYRLYSEPTRLWRRYLIEPLFLSPLLIADFMTRR